jgi:hypothetical protein
MGELMKIKAVTVFKIELKNSDLSCVMEGLNLLGTRGVEHGFSDSVANNAMALWGEMLHAAQDAVEDGHQ